MSIQGVLLRFFLLYIVLIIAAGFAMSHFGMKQANAVNIGILAGCIFWVCSAFGKKNGRYFSAAEKTAVVLGIVAIDLLLQFFFALVALPQTANGVNAKTLALAVGLVGILHAIAIYFFVGIAKKPLVKQGVISG